MSGSINDSREEILRVFNQQRIHKYSVKRTTAAERIEKLERLRRYIDVHTIQLQQAVNADFRKCAAEVNLTEIYPVLSEIKHTVKRLKGWMKPERVNPGITFIGSKSRVFYEPKGVTLIISPWNYPFLLAVDPLVSAIAAGNCVILKPSEFSTNTSSFIRQMISELFHEKEIAVFEGDYRVAQSLLELPFNHIFFTGSPQVGKAIMGSAARNLASVTLELGGKSPVIIDQSADIENAASKIAWGKFINAGQICVAPDYLLVPEQKEKEVIEKIKKKIIQYYGSIDRIDGNPDYCRIISTKHFKRIKGLIEASLLEGARIEFGGVFKEDENFISPTIISSIQPLSSIMQEEIFGPVLPVLTYQTQEEAIRIINSMPNPLALYIFSKNNAAIHNILSNTSSGDAVINDVVVHVANVNLPFGGFNNSGIGKAHGVQGFKAFSHQRSVIRQPRKTMAQMLYPPYTEKVNRLIRFTMRYF